MSEYIDHYAGDSGLVVRWFRQHGARKQAILMQVRPSTGGLESVAMLSVAQAEALSEVAGLGDDDLYHHGELSGALEDDQQIPQESTAPAIEPYCEPCET